MITNVILSSAFYSHIRVLPSRPSVRISVRPSGYPSVRPDIRPDIRPCGYPSVRPDIRPDIRPSIRPSVRIRVLPLPIFKYDLLKIAKSACISSLRQQTWLIVLFTIKYFTRVSNLRKIFSPVFFVDDELIILSRICISCPKKRLPLEVKFIII